MMKNLTLAQTALTQIPSGFAMPAGMRTVAPVCGHVAGSAARFDATGVVRDRQVKATLTGIGTATLKGGPRVTQGYFPGTSAWSPPTC